MVSSTTPNSRVLQRIPFLFEAFAFLVVTKSLETPPTTCTLDFSTHSTTDKMFFYMIGKSMRPHL